jgi:hypothetical protein
MQPILVRLAMVDHGFTPIPVIGKVPPLKKWQETTGVCKATLEDWDRNWPNASNTGILTRLTPTIDLDLLNDSTNRQRLRPRSLSASDSTDSAAS